MTITVRNLEWLNHNSQRAYPLIDEATHLDTTGSFKIPDEFIVSLYFPVHWGQNVDVTSFFIYKIASFEAGYSVTLGYSSASGVVEVATALIAASAHSDNQVYNLGGIGDYVDSRGHIAIGSLDNISTQPSGFWEFDVLGAGLDPDAIRPHIRGVMSLRAENGTELSSHLYGNVRLQAGRNFRITPILAAAADPILVFDAIEGEGLTEDCVCVDEAPPIKTINGVSPSLGGNFAFLGNDCIEISGGQNSITFTDVCSEPCCGCNELEVVTKALETFGSKAATLENFLVSLEARVTQMDMVVLGSRIGDRGCASDTGVGETDYPAF